MWVIRINNDPGPDYGEHEVGYFMPIGGDHIFKAVIHFPATRQGFDAARNEIHYLNGGMPTEHIGEFITRFEELLQQISDNLVKKMTFKDY